MKKLTNKVAVITGGNSGITDEKSLAGELIIFQGSWDAEAQGGVEQTFGNRTWEIELKNATHNPVSLSTLLKGRPVVLAWFRGGCFPFS